MSLPQQLEKASWRKGPFSQVFEDKEKFANLKGQCSRVTTIQKKYEGKEYQGGEKLRVESRKKQAGRPVWLSPARREMLA